MAEENNTTKPEETKQDVIKECNELGMRLQNLAERLEDDKYLSTLAPMQQDLLLMQFHSMQSYYQTLAMRLKTWNMRPEEEKKSNIILPEGAGKLII